MNNGQTHPSSSSELNHPFFTDGNGINDPSFNPDLKNRIVNTETSGPNPLTPEEKPNPDQIPNDKNETDEPSVGIQFTSQGGLPEKDASGSKPLTNPVEEAKKLEEEAVKNPTGFYRDYQNLRDSSGENNND